MPDPTGSTLRLTAGPGLVFDWDEPWNRWLAGRDDDEALAWIHAGVAVTADNLLVVVSHNTAEAVVLTQDATIADSFHTGVTQGHGLLIARDGDAQVLWIADNTSHRQRSADGQYPNVFADAPGRVVKLSLDGQQLMSIGVPPLAAYQDGRFCPTGVAVDDDPASGSGDIWVADGYGQSYVHRYRRDGSYVASLDGEEGAGRFACPHAVWIDRRHREPELYISDRTNARLQVYDLEGRFKRVVGEGGRMFRRPGGFARVGDYLIVAELEARLAVLDLDDQVVGYLGSDDEAGGRPGFPNRLDVDGHPQRPAPLSPGRFNSPHGICSDAVGNLYISEFLIGGRLIKLTHRPS